ncbi:MAG: SDR family NAD(P)-dependent oxidoreductase [Rhodoglobus sp.]
MELELAGRTAIVTGGAGGIGAAVVAALVREGVRVAVLDRDTPALAGMSDTNDATYPVAVDVTDEVSVADAVARATDHLGGLDLLVGCAGISGPVGRSLIDTTLAEWNEVFAVNVAGNFLALKHALPALTTSSAASIVLVASDSALVAASGMVPYCASKAAVVQLARALAVEVADQGIRVNALCPSIVDTGMSRDDLDLPEGFSRMGYPVHTAAEVADQILFLLSPRSRAVNATAVISDFGHSARSNFPA